MSSRRSRLSSGRATGRSCSSPRRPDYGPESGSHLSIATSIRTRVSSTSAAPTGTAGSRCRRPKRASAPCHCRRSRLRRSSSYRRMGGRPSCSRPAQLAAGITPLRRVYDLRHTFATFALRAGISAFELSRYMGTSLGMIGREHAIRLLDAVTGADVHAVDAAWTSSERVVADGANVTTRLSRQKRKAL